MKEEEQAKNDSELLLKADFKNILKESLLISLVILLIIPIKEGVFYLMTGNPPEISDVIVFLILAVSGGLLRMSVPLFSGKGLAKSLKLKDKFLEIERFSGKIINIPLKDLEKAAFNFMYKTDWVFTLNSEEISLSSEGFKDNEWNELSMQMLGAIPHIEMDDLNEEFNNGLCRGLERLTPYVIISGIVISLLLYLMSYKIAALISGMVFISIIIIFMALADAFAEPDNKSKTVTLLKLGKFYGIKLIAVVPLLIIYFGIISPPKDFKAPSYENLTLYYVSNLMFFGFMALSIIWGGGLSYRQFETGYFKGVNKYWKNTFVAFLVLMGIGFALKCWNEV